MFPDCDHSTGLVANCWGELLLADLESRGCPTTCRGPLIIKRGSGNESLLEKIIYKWIMVDVQFPCVIDYHES